MRYETSPAQDLRRDAESPILALWRDSDDSELESSVITNLTQNVMLFHYAREANELTSNREWHFSTIHASVWQLEDFSLGTMATEMNRRAPLLGRLLDVLMTNSAVPTYDDLVAASASNPQLTVAGADDAGEDIDADGDGLEQELGDDIRKSVMPRNKAERRAAVLAIVSVGNDCQSRATLTDLWYSAR